MSARGVLLLGLMLMVPVPVHAQSPVTFCSKDGALHIQVDRKPFATYVWGDRNVRRPYFAHLHAPNGKQVTRTHPPVAGTDATDHDAMHPGLWLAFGDLGGADFWRNKGTVAHVEFVEKPKAAKDGGTFAVRNRYAAGGRTVCEEVCRVAITVRPEGYLIDWTSEFAGPADFHFGDQEEMGLGVRVATPLTVKNGGQILNSGGAKNEKEAWGKAADWCDYAGKVDGEEAGVALMPDPANFRRSWFHARDYGVLVANAFGRNAFTRGEKSKVVVKKGETFRLRFGILVHAGKVDVGAAFADWTGEPTAERVEAAEAAFRTLGADRQVQADPDSGRTAYRAPSPKTATGANRRVQFRDPAACYALPSTRATTQHRRTCGPGPHSVVGLARGWVGLTSCGG
jgi:hypothetical protein